MGKAIFIALCLVPALAEATNEELERLCQAQVAAQSATPFPIRRDWTPTDAGQHFPLPHSASSFAGSPLDLPALGGPAMGRARPFGSATIAILLDAKGNLVAKPKSRESGLAAFAYDFQHDWHELTPYEPGDLTPYVSRRFDAAAATPEPRRFFLVGPRLVAPEDPFPAAGTAPEDSTIFPKNADRFPAILVERAGSLHKGDRRFGFRYPVMRLGPGTSESAGLELCRTLKMSDRPGLVFRRPLDADERAELEHLVETGEREMRRVRVLPGGGADAARRARQLRAFRYVEIPPTAKPGLLLRGAAAPLVPEAATLLRRWDARGLGTEHRYAFYAPGGRLVEISNDGSHWTLRAIAAPGETNPPSWTVADADLWKILPALHFPGDFVGHYLGE